MSAGNAIDLIAAELTGLQRQVSDITFVLKGGDDDSSDTRLYRFDRSDHRTLLGQGPQHSYIERTLAVGVGKGVPRLW